MKFKNSRVDINGVDISAFVESVEVNEIEAPKFDEAIRGFTSFGPVTITVDFAEHRCGNCGAPFAEDPAAGVAMLTHVQTGTSIKLCPACYVALSTDAT